MLSNLKSSQEAPLSCPCRKFRAIPLWVPFAFILNINFVVNNHGGSNSEQQNPIQTPQHLLWGNNVASPHRHLYHKSDFSFGRRDITKSLCYGLSVLLFVLDCCLLFGDFCSHTYWAFCLHESACWSPHHPVPNKNPQQLTDPVH